MDNKELIEKLETYNKFLNGKVNNLFSSKILSEYLDEFSLNNFNNISQCKALTWNSGEPKQCSHISTIGYFCKIHSKAENKECKHCFTHHKRKMRHKYRWECLGTIDIKEQSKSINLEEFIKQTFDPIPENEYEEIEYEVLQSRISSVYTHIESSIIAKAVDKYIEERY